MWDRVIRVTEFKGSREMKKKKREKGGKVRIQKYKKCRISYPFLNY
jgi:hypothetical protein